MLLPVLHGLGIYSAYLAGFLYLRIQSAGRRDLYKSLHGSPSERISFSCYCKIFTVLRG